MPLAQAELDAFDQEGWFLAKDVIPHHYIHALQDEIDAVIDAQVRVKVRERARLPCSPLRAL